MKKANSDNNYHYNKDLKAFARELRKNMTKGEACLWKYVLAGRNMLGYQFRRQRPVLNYIADFMCLELLLIIEVDGITHEFDGAGEKDRLRDENLEAVGFTVLRFSDQLILNDITTVSEYIVKWIEKNAKKLPPSAREGRHDGNTSKKV